jgi:hypothetical protein
VRWGHRRRAEADFTGIEGLSSGEKRPSGTGARLDEITVTFTLPDC